MTGTMQSQTATVREVAQRLRIGQAIRITAEGETTERAYYGGLLGPAPHDRGIRIALCGRLKELDWHQIEALEPLSA
jgi:hypothetical protein